MNRREEILRATSEAARMVERFPVGNRSSFDIVGALSALDIPVRFQPLRKLWGACVSVDGAEVGVLVTTLLDLSVQRFTLAHELGHVLLGHTLSFDEKVGFLGRFSSRSRPVQEVAADTFAAELLAPRALIRASAERHGWNRAALSDPQNVYQLSLRLGVSFVAACWALAAQSVISQPAAAELAKVKPKSVKQELGVSDLSVDAWANVWRLARADSGTYLEAGPNDLFAVDVVENASGGFLWELVDAGEETEIVADNRTPGAAYGDGTTRTLWVRFGAPGLHRLTFQHRRPWSGESVEHIDVSVENHGKERRGLPRRTREAALASTAN